MGSSKVVTFSYLDLPPMALKEPSMGDELSCPATNACKRKSRSAAEEEEEKKS
jgi:hypothetical protein